MRRRRHRHRLRRLRRRCVVVVVDSVRICASSVGQNGVNRPRAFKVIFVRSGFIVRRNWAHATTVVASFVVRVRA